MDQWVDKSFPGETHESAIFTMQRFMQNLHKACTKKLCTTYTFLPVFYTKRSFHFVGWNQEVVYSPMQKVSDLKCDEWMEHPVLLIQRDTFANFFHNSEDMVNALLALGILKWKMQDLQLLITDLYPKGPFWDIWSSVFTKSGYEISLCFLLFCFVCNDFLSFPPLALL